MADAINKNFNPKGLKIGHLNIRSIRNNIDQFKHEFRNRKFDILTISETWLNEYDSNEEIYCKGYEIIRQDRRAKNRRGGGLISFVNENYSVVDENLK